MVVRCHFCQDPLTGTHHFQPCRCPHYYHVDCFHHQIRYQNSDGLSAIQCSTCETYYNREFHSNNHRRLCYLFQTISEKFFWLYGGFQAIGGVVTLMLWEPKHLVDTLATVSVLYNAVLWTTILLVNCYLERPNTYRTLVWWAPSLLLVVAITLYPKVWLDWISLAISSALLHRTRRDVFVLSSEYHYQRIVSLNSDQQFELEEIGHAGSSLDHPIVHDFSSMITAETEQPTADLLTSHSASENYLDLPESDTASNDSDNTDTGEITGNESTPSSPVKSLTINITSPDPGQETVEEKEVVL